METAKWKSSVFDHLAETVVCPKCHGSLEVIADGMRCASCDITYSLDSAGYLEFILDESSGQIITTHASLTKWQSSTGAHRLDNEYILPWLEQEEFESVLDVGCGIGRIITKLAASGYQSYGVDLPCLSGFWNPEENDPGRFFCSEARNLPFPDEFFDVVISMGVIEHIGTSNGHSTLSDDYLDQRQQFADEILRITKPDGRILITCPNKRFPIDPQHEVKDRYSRESAIITLRDNIFSLTGMNIHRTWGPYHLLSHAEIKRLFCEQGGASCFRPLSPRGFFSLDMFQSGYLKPLRGLASLYLNRMPNSLLSSFLNPYVIVEIRK